MTASSSVCQQNLDVASRARGGYGDVAAAGAQMASTTPVIGALPTFTKSANHPAVALETLSFTSPLTSSVTTAPPPTTTVLAGQFAVPLVGAAVVTGIVTWATT